MSLEKQPYHPSPEEQAKIQKERTISDAGLLKKGSAEYIVGERGEYRLEITKDQFNELHGAMISEFDEKIKKEIREKWENKSLEEIIADDPELEKNIETIPVKTEGERLVLLRNKQLPEIAFVVWSEKETSTQGKIALNISEPRISEKHVKSKDFSTMCACCSVELYGLQNPHKYPYKEDIGEDGKKIHIGADGKEFSTYKQWESFSDKWSKENPEEEQKSEEWEKRKKEEFMESMQKACDDNGIKFLIVRKAELLEKRYGEIKGVQTLEITENNKVRDKIDTIEQITGKKRAGKIFF